MREINKISQDLFDKLRSRFENLRLGDEKAKHTSDPEKAVFFNFDYNDGDIEEGEGNNLGNITISIMDGESLKIYFGRNISHNMEHEQRDRWFEFMQELRKFAKRNLMSFDTRDIARSNINLRDIKQQSKTDGAYSSMEFTNESRLYGTTKTSFENVGTARIRIIHSESVNPEQRGSRARHINAVYVENNQGERFKMQHNRLAEARAMARHISEGGAPYDDIGQHIVNMVREMEELGRFVRVMRRRTFEDTTTTTMVEAATEHYQSLHKQLNFMQGRRAYQNFVENFQPQAEQLDEVDVNEIKERFVKKIFDDRMTAALPHVYKAYQLHEQSQQRKIHSVSQVIKNHSPLQLAVNEGMDEYFKALSFTQPQELVVRVLEDIAERAVTQPDVAEFAQHWAKNYNTVTEDSDTKLQEHKAMAVQLVTHYLRDLRNLAENSDLRIQNEQLDQRFQDPDILGEDQTWAAPDSTEEVQELRHLLSNPLPAGVDGEDAVLKLSKILGNDTLADNIEQFAKVNGAEADARQTVVYWLQKNMPSVYQQLNMGDEEMDQADVKQPTSPQPIDATGETVPPAPTNNTGGTGMDTPQGANLAEDHGLHDLMRLAGMPSILVK